MNDLISGMQQGQISSLCEKPIGGNVGVVSILKQRQSHLQSQLDEVNAALAALEANPEIAKTLELVTKAARY